MRDFCALGSLTEGGASRQPELCAKVQPSFLRERSRFGRWPWSRSRVTPPQCAERGCSAGLQLDTGSMPDAAHRSSRMDTPLDHWFWQQEYWLPPGITWKDTEMKRGLQNPAPRDLLLSLPLALGFMVLRYSFERKVALPLSRLLGVQNQRRVQVSHVPKLEAFYTQRSHQPSQSEVVVLAKQCGLTPRQTETWFRRRGNQDRPTKTKKFCEACWRFAFYLIAFMAGLASLIDTPWFWDQRECWRGYPRQDFKEQIIHHVVTVLLIGFSYCGNYVRVGTLVMLIHDSSDFLLESAKMFNYAGWQRTCDALFVIFATVFLVTRLVVFPNRILHTTLVLSMEFFAPFFGYYFFNFLLLVLQALHVFWGYLILRMIYKFVFLGKVERDERSDEESGDEEDERGEKEEESMWEERKCVLDSRLAALANKCALSNLTNEKSAPASAVPKSRWHIASPANPRRNTSRRKQLRGRRCDQMGVLNYLD
uniref:Ceramide synthase 4a n=1 Tax=Scleropages formosus TaxID=113540 RepID=A0A8C9V0T9_SCLFO